MYNTNIFALTLVVLLFHNSLFKSSTRDVSLCILLSFQNLYSENQMFCFYTFGMWLSDCLNYHMSTTCVVFVYFRGKSWPVLQMASTFRAYVILLLSAICSPLGERSSASSEYLPFQSSFPGIFIWLNYFNILNITSEVSLRIIFYILGNKLMPLFYQYFTFNNTMAFFILPQLCIWPG